MSSIIYAAMRNPTIKAIPTESIQALPTLVLWQFNIVNLIFAPVGSLYLLGLSAIEVHMEKGLNIFYSI